MLVLGFISEFKDLHILRYVGLYVCGLSSQPQ